MPEPVLEQKAAQASVDDDQASTLMEVGPCQFALRGSLNLSTVPALARQGGRLLKALRAKPEAEPLSVEIDLSGVKRSSSAGIALLLDWVDQASRDGIELHFRNWPDALVRIATFSNVEDLLKIEAVEHG